MNGNIKPFGLRLPPELKAWAKNRAETNNRSLNAEIVTIIERVKESEDTSEAISGNGSPQ